MGVGAYGTRAVHDRLLQLLTQRTQEQALQRQIAQQEFENSRLTRMESEGTRRWNAEQASEERRLAAAEALARQGREDAQATGVSANLEPDTPLDPGTAGVLRTSLLTRPLVKHQEAHLPSTQLTGFAALQGAPPAGGGIVRSRAGNPEQDVYTGNAAQRFQRSQAAAQAEDRRIDNERQAQQQRELQQYREDALEARRAGGGAGGGAASEDIGAIVDAIISGDQSPELTGLYRNTTAIRAGLARKGFNHATALTDWRATTRHIATLNGPQQERLNQAIESLPDMLDSVDALASQWKGGNFPPLNKANLVAAKNGVYGPAIASVAVQLDSQIADVTADLGNVYMGGNSPTDHALELAGKSLKGEWSEKVLHDMVALAKKNVRIRRNSVRNSSVRGDSPTNPYDRSGGAAPGPAAAPGATPQTPAQLREKYGTKRP